MINNVYNNMWQRFEQAAAHNNYELDPFLADGAKDTRRGITALAYLEQGNSEFIEEITHFQSKVKNIEPNQYFHPISELHLTILSIISCIAGFKLSDIPKTDYSDIFQVAANNIGPIEIQFKGITASPNCIMLQGFPNNDALEHLRESLRSEFKASGLRTNFDSRYKLVTAHSSLIRFRVPINNSNKLFNLCQRYRDYDFGNARLTDIHLVFNNWYQNLAMTQSIACQTLTHR